MLGMTFQEDIPLKMFVFPANSKAALPEVFARFAEIPEQPAQCRPGCHRGQPRGLDRGLDPDGAALTARA